MRPSPRWPVSGVPLRETAEACGWAMPLLDGVAQAWDDATAEGAYDAPRAQHHGRRCAPRALGSPRPPAEAHESVEPAPAGSLGECRRPEAAPPHAGGGSGAALRVEHGVSRPPRARPRFCGDGGPAGAPSPVGWRSERLGGANRAAGPPVPPAVAWEEEVQEDP